MHAFRSGSLAGALSRALGRPRAPGRPRSAERLSAVARPRAGALLASLVALGLAVAGASPARAAPNLWITGVNIAGAEFNPGATRMNFDYVYPSASQITYWAGKGFKVIRVPVLTSRILGSDFRKRTADWTELVNIISHANKTGTYILIDFHQYGGMDGGGLIGRDAKATKAFVAAWTEVAKRLKDRRNVIFGLMNEPNRQSASEWLVGANAAIAAIRKAGARQLIMVPGSYWSGAHSWVSSDNDTVMLKVRDPANNFVFEVHQYLDSDSSGTTNSVVAGAGATRLKAFTDWARSKRVKGFLGEFGFPRSPEGLVEGRALLQHMADNKDVWIGWAYWAAGAWWGDYHFSVEPDNRGDKPQTPLLVEFR
ncbi:glycoside hydrolase family 5 protein [Chthonobacter rhizosphaerae]|uniref:glycoside hydrolase family 5 protein n=1 Tax=Chthonobacter rhizosphaerae TaxID=2735553 RepID=UPI0015EF7B4C|nr:glycoside hydrolase family 5 protein [Chthonobacter rhizosphaerae]